MISEMIVALLKPAFRNVSPSTMKDVSSRTESPSSHDASEREISFMILVNDIEFSGESGESAVTLGGFARIHSLRSPKPDYYSKHHQDDYGPQNLQAFIVRKMCIGGTDHDDP
jgi:hypothetical protein